MRAIRFGCAALIAGALLLGPRAASAQTANQAQQIQQQIEQLRTDFNNRIAALEAQLATLQGGQAPPAPVPAPPPAAAPPTEVGQGAGLTGAKVFNPDMAVIGDFLGAAGRNT